MLITGDHTPHVVLLVLLFIDVGSECCLLHACVCSSFSSAFVAIPPENSIMMRKLRLCMSQSKNPPSRGPERGTLLARVRRSVQAYLPGPPVGVITQASLVSLVPTLHTVGALGSGFASRIHRAKFLIGGVLRYARLCTQTKPFLL